MPCDGPSNPLSFRPVRGAGIRMWKRNVHMYVRTPRYAKGETISDGRQWGFKWRPQWYQLHAGIEFNWIEGTVRGALLYRLRPTFCNHVVVDFNSFSRGSQPTLVILSDMLYRYDSRHNWKATLYTGRAVILLCIFSVTLYIEFILVAFQSYETQIARVSFRWVLSVLRGKPKEER